MFVRMVYGNEKLTGFDSLMTPYNQNYVENLF